MSDCSSGVCAFTPLSSQTTARPDGRPLVRKPSHNSDRQTVRELCRQGLSTVRTSRTAVVDTQSDSSGCTPAGLSVTERGQISRWDMAPRCSLETEEPPDPPLAVPTDTLLHVAAAAGATCWNA